MGQAIPTELYLVGVATVIANAALVVLATTWMEVALNGVAAGVLLSVLVWSALGAPGVDRLSQYRYGDSSLEVD